MKIFTYHPEMGKPIEHFESAGAYAKPVVQLPEGGTIHLINISPGGVVGYHPAVGDQLFLVIQGEGTVRGAEQELKPVQAGQAAFWQAGEGHETRSEAGLAAVVIEGHKLEFPGEPGVEG